MAGPVLQGVLFDLDGTLVDSARETVAILNGMRGDRGMPPLPESEYRVLISHGAGALVRRACEVEDEGAVVELVTTFRERYRATHTPPDSLYPGVVHCLAGLVDGGLALAICTNKPDVLCRRVLGDTGIGGWFQAVVAGGVTAKGKPRPEPVLRAIAGLGLIPGQVVLVGDSTVDQAAAAAAGIPFVFFSAGYDDGVDRASAVAIVDRMDQLVPLLLSQPEKLRP